MKNYRIGIFGLGTVASGLIKILKKEKINYQNRFGVNFELSQVVVHDLQKKRDPELGELNISDDPKKIIENPAIDIVVELIGGKTVAKSLIEKSLQAGKHVVTANKDLIASEGRKLSRLAKEKHVGLFYEAAVAGGIPILRSLSNSLASDEIEQINGIVNGTSNFILSQMRQKRISYSSALKTAQEKGFAEADPTNDVDGIDAAYKLQILTDFAFGKQINQRDIQMSGIRTITQADLHDVADLGYEIKLLANATVISNKLELSVAPTLVPKEHPLASVQNENNAVFVNGRYSGGLMFYGPGAGEFPTANSVAADLIELVKRINYPESFNSNFSSDLTLAKPKDRIASRYIVFNVANRPGVMHKLSAFFLMSDINFRNIRQYDPVGENTRVVIITYPASDAQLNPVKTTIRKARGVEIVHEFKLLIEPKEVTNA
ncbi:homoserine dehydrogenase [Oenococcus sp. UCMA 16435]|nr:homoserine dehydrogenase [Oenococcus sp. UCMA 16435]MDN6967874.1 homoserine dehydrogenase [Oenococcus sp. UCMA 17063]